MKTIFWNGLAVVAGIVAGSFVNIALVNAGPFVVPIPEGADVSSMDKLRESMKLFKPINFLFPFLAHALGTLVGSFVAAKLAASHRIFFAMFLGVFFLLGGIAAISMIGGPLWFKVLDLGTAYLPMAFLGAKLAGVWRQDTAAT